MELSLDDNLMRFFCSFLSVTLSMLYSTGNWGYFKTILSNKAALGTAEPNAMLYLYMLWVIVCTKSSPLKVLFMGGIRSNANLTFDPAC